MKPHVLMIKLSYWAWAACVSTKEQTRGNIRVKTRSLIEQMMESRKMFLTFEPVDKTLWYDHSNETSSSVLSHATSYLVCSSDIWVRGRNTIVWPDSSETSSAVILHGKPCVSLTLATFASERFKDREKPD